MRQKVLLVFPNTSNEAVMPLAIGILSAIAREVGFDVRYFETSLYRKALTAGEERERTGEFKFVDRDSVIKLLPADRLRGDFQKCISTYEPDILAATANSLEYEFFAEVLADITFHKSRTFVIVGGVHATVAPDEVIRHHRVDAICIGEGEHAWEEFLIRFKGGEDFAEVRNLWVKQGGKIHRNPLRPLLTEKELWRWPLDCSFFDKRHFLKPFDGRVYHRGQIELSRGCPYGCSYCVNSGLKAIYKGLGRFVRTRPFDNLCEGIKAQLQLGAEMMQLQDECFLSVRARALEDFCNWYGREIKLPLLVQTRPETVSEEKIRILGGMNIPVQVSCGVESGSERILKKICNRHTSKEQMRKAFQIIKRYGLRATAYTMIGFPTETREEAFETIHFIRELNVDNSIMSVFVPFRGVPLREYCIERGYITGKERTATFTDASILRNQPMTAEEVCNLRRTYSLYTKLPEEYFPQIELCERQYEKHRDLFERLVKIVNERY